MAKRVTDVSIDYPSSHVIHKPSVLAIVKKRVSSGVFISIAVTFIFTSSSPWWMLPATDGILAGLSESFRDAAAVALLIVAIVALLLLFVLVYLGIDEENVLAQKQQTAESEIVQLMFKIRNSLQDEQSLDDLVCNEGAYRNYFTMLACQIEKVCEPLVKRGKVGVALRVLSETDAGRTVYTTVARAGALSERRELHTEDLAESSGLLELLTKAGQPSEAVFSFNDAKGAYDAGIIHHDFNSSHEPYASEIASMTVARVNLANKNEQGRPFDELIGILYITSNDKGAFDGSLTNIVVTVSELLSLVLERVALRRVELMEDEILDSVQERLEGGSA